MLISPINNIRYEYTNKSPLFISNPTFKTGVKTIEAPIGRLKRDTKILIDDILHAHRDILSKLELKTEKGLEILAQNYPDIRLGNVLAFHNCGEDNNTIIIKTGETEKNKGLTYLSRRLGTRRSEKHQVLEAFMLDGNERLVKNFNKEFSERFPADKEYYSQEEMEKLGHEEDLYKLLQELDFAMLKFRKFLDKNMSDNLKLPDGRIPYQIASEIRQTLKRCDEIDSRSSNEIQRLKLLELNRAFPGYVDTPGGLRSYMFKNLGEEQVTINFSQVNREGENLKRLAVYNKNGRPIRTFLIKNDEKFISNLTKTNPTYIPDKYTYADSKEIEKKYLPEFQKYLKLYTDKLEEYSSYIDSYIKNQADKKRVGKLSTEVHFAIKDSIQLYNTAKSTFQKINPRKAAEIKRIVGNLDLNFDRNGIWFNNPEKGKTVQILPINNKRHENLARITIIDNETQETQLFLIKDFSFIVKNYNQSIPENIPAKLFYANIAEVEEANLEQYCRFIKLKLEELNAQADYAFENRNMPAKRKERKNSITPTAKTEEKIIIKECKKQFVEALKHLDLGIENFNKSLQEIQEKIAELYKNKLQG